MASPKHPRHFSDDFKRQTVKLHNAGKPMSGIMAEYDLGRSTVRRRITSINATGSPRAADNRTPDQARVIELERENRRLRMEVGALKKQAAPMFARKRWRWRRTPAAARYRRNARSSACQGRSTTPCARGQTRRRRPIPSGPTCWRSTERAAVAAARAR